jgi:hypothetical protein
MTQKLPPPLCKHCQKPIRRKAYCVNENVPLYVHETCLEKYVNAHLDLKPREKKTWRERYLELHNLRFIEVRNLATLVYQVISYRQSLDNREFVIHCVLQFELLAGTIVPDYTWLSNPSPDFTLGQQAVSLYPVKQNQELATMLIHVATLKAKKGKKR